MGRVRNGSSRNRQDRRSPPRPSFPNLDPPLPLSFPLPGFALPPALPTSSFMWKNLSVPSCLFPGPPSGSAAWFTFDVFTQVFPADAGPDGDGRRLVVSIQRRPKFDTATCHKEPFGEEGTGVGGRRGGATGQRDWRWLATNAEKGQ